MREIEQTMRVVLVEVLDNGITADEVRPDADLLDEYGLDSMKGIAFLLRLESELGVDLGPECLDMRPCTVQSLIQYVGHRTAGARP